MTSLRKACEKISMFFSPFRQRETQFVASCLLLWSTSPPKMMSTHEETNLLLREKILLLGSISLRREIKMQTAKFLPLKE